MSHLFLSYARADSEFTRRLHKRLEDSQISTWVDWRDIPATSDWLEEIYKAIEDADAFVYLMTPASVASEVCVLELAHAVANGKRIIPLEVETVDPRIVPAPAAQRQWISFVPKFDTGLSKFIEALEVDPKWVAGHTNILRAARTWDEQNREQSFLLRGKELESAERWLSAYNEDRSPTPTELQRQFVMRSRSGAISRQRRLIFAISSALAITVALGSLALYQRDQAIKGERHAQSQTLTSRADHLLNSDPRVAGLLAVEANKLFSTPESTSLIRAALGQSEYDAALFADGAVTKLVYSAASGITAVGDTTGAIFTWKDEDSQISRAAGHEGGVVDLDLSEGGELLASAGREGAVKVWDVPDGDLRATLESGAEKALCASFGLGNASGLLATCHDDAVVRLWNAENGELMGEIGHKGQKNGIVSAKFDPQGGRLLTVSELPHGADMWDLASGEHIAAVPLSIDRTPASFSGDGRTFIHGGRGGGEVIVRATTTSAAIATLRHLPRVAGASLNKDGSQALTYGGNGSVLIWDVQSESVVQTLDHSAEVGSAVFDAEEQIVLTAGADGIAKAWDARSGRRIANLRGHVGAISRALFIREGGEVVTASVDGTVRRWSLDGARPVAVVRQDEAIGPISFDPQERLITGSADGSARIWEWRDHNELLVLTPKRKRVTSGLSSMMDDLLPVMAVEPDPAGSRVAIARARIMRMPIGEVTIWDTATGERIKELGQHIAAFDLEWSNDGRKLAVAEASGASIWDVDTQDELMRLEGHEGGVTSVSFGPSGKLVATGSEDRRVRIWDAESGEMQQLLEGHNDQVVNLAFSPDGSRLATASLDKTARIWDVKTGESLRVFTGHSEGVISVNFRADGEFIVTASRDGTARIWETAAGRQISRFHAGASGANHAHFVDDATIAVASNDGRVRFFDCNAACGELSAAFEQIGVLAGELTPNQRAEFAGL